MPAPSTSPATPASAGPSDAPPVRARPSRSVWSPSYWYRRIVTLRATPHQIAMGTAVGVFLAFTPTFGFQMVLALAVAFLFKLSKPATIIPVWISNPLTIVPVYGATYAVGALFWPGETIADLPAALGRFSNVSPFDLASLRQALRDFWDLGAILMGPLWIGAFIVGVPLAAITYPVTRRGVVAYRHHRAHVRHERRQRREARRRAAETSA
ncbi:MAG: DUF2062 domain-containing protein [Planctomycetota bacterium]